MSKVLLASLLSVAALAWPSVAVGQTVAQNSVAGSGTSSFCGPFTVSATSDPGGANPSGHVTCGTFLDGPVTCLEVTGGVALLTINDATFGSVAFRITDGGPNADTVEGIPGSGCTQPQPAYVDFGFTGDIVVREAPTLPISKAECKHGGWRTFGPMFKNQGQCVAFVQRGPKA